MIKMGQDQTKIFIALAMIGISVGAFAQTPVKKSKALVIKFTETWCGPCGTWGWTTADGVVEGLGDKGYYMGAMKTSTPASMNGNCVGVMATQYNITGVPTFIVGDADGGQSSNQVLNAATTISSSNTVASPAGKYTIAGSTINVTAKAKFWEAANGEYFMTAFLVEDSVLAAQNGKTGTVAHHHILRGSMMANASPWGESMVNGAVTANQEFTKTFTMAIQDGWKKEKLEVYVVIYKKNGTKYDFVNVEKATTGASGTAINSLENNVASMQLYPNPAIQQAFLAISAQKAMTVGITITDAMGRRIYSANEQHLNTGENKIGINTSTYSSGIYNVSLVTTEGVLHTTLVVN
jgi:hypothetical protein